MLSDTGPNHSRRVGYIVKRYPRYSETFIVNEILAHEAAGLDVEIFSLLPSCDTHFQSTISKVRAPVTYLPFAGIKMTDFWEELKTAAKDFPDFWKNMNATLGEEAINVLQASMLSRLAKERNIRHLHAHFATTPTSVARMAARLAGITYSFTAHAKDIFHESVRRSDVVRKLSEATSVVTVSEYNLRYLGQTYGEAAEGVKTIYNGLDLNEFSFEIPSEREPRIVAVGRLVEKKGFSDLIQACEILSQRGRKFECLIIGTGELEGELREQIQRSEARAQISLIGPRSQHEVIGLVRSAAIFAAPCVVGSDGNRDGLPTVLLESMALGTPCVSTDVTGIPEVLHDGATGLMVGQHDPKVLANAIERLLTDADLRVRLAKQARRLMEEKFDIKQNTVQLREIFAGHSKSVTAESPKSTVSTVREEIMI